MLEIEEILGRCEQHKGMVEPFITRDDNDDLYYAKGSNTQAEGLIKELIAACLAKEFGLPIPDAEILYLDPQVKALNLQKWQDDLGFENLFGSKSVAPCDVLTISDIAAIPTSLQKDVIVFDYWIQNNDRFLTEHSGNANLLITRQDGQLWVIDHNLAFDNEFNINDLHSLHVFRDAIKDSPVDLFERDIYRQKMSKILEKYENIIELIPSEWINSLPAESSIIEDVEAILRRYEQNEFWGGLS